MVKTELQPTDATYSIEMATMAGHESPPFTSHPSYRGEEVRAELVWHRWNAVDEDTLEALYTWHLKGSTPETWSSIGNDDGPPVLVIAWGEVNAGDTVVLTTEGDEQDTATVTDVSSCSITIDWYGHGVFLLELGSDDKFYAAGGDGSPIEVTRV